MRRTAAAAMLAALVLAGCEGDADEDLEPGPSPTQTTGGAPGDEDDTATGVGEDEEGTEQPTDEPTDDSPTEEPTDDSPTEEPTDGEATDEPTDGEATDGASTDDPDAPDLADGPAWTDPTDRVEVAQSRDALEVSQEITGIRIAAHDGFDRVVLDLTGDEVVLGWFGLYEDAPYEAGSGRPIDFAGNAVLSVPVEGINWTTPHPERADGSEIGGPGGTRNVVEVVFGVLFEGQQQVFVSVVDRTPYRIFPLDDPARIVIDVQHS